MVILAILPVCNCYIRPKNKRMFRISVTWFIFNLKRRGYILIHGELQYIHNIYCTCGEINESPLTWGGGPSYKEANFNPYWSYAQPHSAATILPLAWPPNILFSPTHLHTRTFTANDDFKMPDSSSVGHTSIVQNQTTSRPCHNLLPVAAHSHLSSCQEPRQKHNSTECQVD